jgi:hypothetical protein
VQHRSNFRFGNLAKAFALVAAVAFVLQGLALTISHAAAAAGSLPEPAASLTGELHVHGELAGHVHHHHGNDGAGHVHAPADFDRSSGALDVDTSSWALYSVNVTVPVSGELQLPDAFPRRFARPRPEVARGIVPPHLVRPPSTSSIA